MTISYFKGEHLFLSNFYRETGGKTLEHRFQAEKFTHLPDIQAEIMEAPTPSAAKRKAHSYKTFVRSDWKQVSVGVMVKLLREKFEYDSHLADQLMFTKEHYLEEGNHWGDQFYGTVDGVGSNVLGLLLMLVRAELLLAEMTDLATRNQQGGF